MRLDINSKKKSVKKKDKNKNKRTSNTWRLNNTFLSSEQVTEDIKREIKKKS